MNARLILKAIQQGQTQKAHSVVAGSGQHGQALVIQAAKGTRYQISDALTFSSPEKIQIKRAGQDLLLAFQGNDVSSPDVVIRGYFDFEDMSLSGISSTGEPMLYDASSGLFHGLMPGKATGVTPQSLAPEQIAAASLAKGSSGWFDSGWGLAALGGAAVLLASAGKSGGSDGSSNAGLSKITAYKADQTKSVPTLNDFKDANVSGVDATNLTGLVSVLPRTQQPLTSSSSIQALVDSYNKVLAEANGSANDVTPSVDPSAADYINLMGANTPPSIATKPAPLALLNDRIKLLNTTEVDVYSELKALADAVEALANLAQATPSTSGTAASSGNLTAANLTTLGVDVTAKSLLALSDAIRQAPDDLSTLDTVDKLKALVTAYNKVWDTANGSGPDDASTFPTAADYAAIHANIGSAATDAAALARLNAAIAQLNTTQVDTVDEINKIAASLDKLQAVASLAAGVALTDAQKFSAEELKALGLTGFSGTTAQNRALALKVSEAIRDKAVDEVQAGTFTQGRLSNNLRVDWNQTQVERLQTLVSLEIIKNYVVDSSNPANTTLAPTLADWQNIGVFKPRNDGSGKHDALSGTELAYLNSAADKLGADALDTPAKAQAVFEAYLRIIQEANGTDADANTSLNPVAADLAAVGVTGDAVLSSKDASRLLLDVIAHRSSTDVDTVSELQALADTAAKVMQAAGGASVSFTTTELSALGLRGASATGAGSNLADFVAHLQATNDPALVNSLAKLQGFMSLSVLQAWARDVNADASASPAIAKTAPAPTAQDYKDMGVVRALPRNADGSDGKPPALMSLADVAALNDAIDTLVDNSSVTTADDALINSLAKVQAIASSYFTILNEANGSASNVASDGTTDLNPTPSWADYTRVGVTRKDGSLVDNVQLTSLLGSVLGEKTFAQVDTVRELQNLANIADEVLTVAGGTGSLTLEKLSNNLTNSSSGTDGLGLQGVNSLNLADINAALRAVTSDVSVDTLPELQSLVSLVRIQRYADAISNDTPTFADWSALKLADGADLVGEMAERVSAYNSAVDALSRSSIDAPEKLQALVASYNKILAEANGSLTDSTTEDPTFQDYANIGLDLSLLWGAAYTGTRGEVALSLLNDAVGELSSAAVDSLAELNALAGVVKALVDHAANANDATPHANPSVNPTVAVSYAGTIPANFAADLSSLGLVGAAKLGDTTYRYNGSQYNYYERENTWASIQNLDVDGSTNLLTYAEVQNIINKYAF